MSASDRRAFLQTSAAAAIALATPFAASAKAKNSVLFTNVKDGETVPSKFTYKFDVTGYTVSPAAEGLIDGTGHHHMIVDGPKFTPPGEVILMDATHKHYGKGQTEGELELEPGSTRSRCSLRTRSTSPTARSLQADHGHREGCMSRGTWSGLAPS